MNRGQASAFSRMLSQTAARPLAMPSQFQRGGGGGAIARN